MAKGRRRQTVRGWLAKRGGVVTRRLSDVVDLEVIGKCSHPMRPSSIHKGVLIVLVRPYTKTYINKLKLCITKII